MNMARLLVQGVDVWMNTPRRPNEASGTSGMKAAMNGVLNFSVLDGWWREGYNGSNGWAIGQDGDMPDLGEQDAADAESCYLCWKMDRSLLLRKMNSRIIYHSMDRPDKGIHPHPGSRVQHPANGQGTPGEGFTSTWAST